MRKLFGGEVGVVHVPAELFFVSFSLEFKVEVDWDEDLIVFAGALLEDVGDCGGEDELLVDGLVEGGVARPPGVEAVQPLGKGVFNFDVVSLDLALQPQGEGGVVDACLAGDVDLFDVVFGECLQHLGADVLLGLLHHDNKK